MPAERGAPALALMAKRPEPGRSKTRLMPELSARRASDAAASLIRETANLAVQAWPGPIHLLCWPDRHHEVFSEIARDTRIRTGVQAAGDLGAKMSQAICRLAARGHPAAVMGCDVPHCAPAQLRRAFELLSRGRSVFGPATDGGYYLIGLQDCLPELFLRHAWGGPDVARQTLQRAAALGIEFATLDAMRDIDDYRDLEAAANELPRLKNLLRKHG